MVWMKRLSRRIYPPIALAIILMMTLPWVAFADEVIADGDGLEPVISQSLDLGTVCLADGATGTVLVAIVRSQGGSNAYANSSTVTIAVESVSGPGLSATMAASPSQIVLPSGWGGLTGGTMSDAVVANVTFAPVETGSHSGQLTFKATGRNASNGNDLVRTTTIAVTANVVNCILATDLNVSPATGVYGGTTSLSATLTANSAGVAGKSIEFTIDGNSAGFAVTDANGIATLSGVSLAGLDAGVYDIDASFAGDSGHSASSGSNTLSISQAIAMLSLSDLTHTYDGTGKAATVTTNPSGLSGVSVTYDGNAALPVDAGSYAVQATLTHQNYAADPATGTLVINPADATVTLSDLQHDYDGTAKAATVTTSPPGLPYTLTYERDGNAVANPTDAGSYDVSVTVTDPNYSGSASGTLVIDPKEITGSFTALDKEYDGEIDATIDQRALSGVIGADDVELSGGTATFADANAGQGKTVTGQGFTLSGDDAGNYVLASTTLVTVADITARPITVKADPQTKVYGEADPSLTYDITDGSLVVGDDFTGALEREPGEDVGGYAITQGTLALSSNYDLTVEPSTLHITARPIEVTANPAGKTYGDADPALTYAITDGSLAFDDDFSGALDREAGEQVGSYDIQQGTLELSANYDLTFIGNTFAIAEREITVTADPQSRVYGESDPVLTYQITNGELVGGDTFSGHLERAPGEDVGTYAIIVGTLSPGSNYAFTFVSADLEITPRPITVTADPQTKVYGEDDPELMYRITDGSLTFHDEFEGALSRAAGEDVGSYAIEQGTLALSDNYDLTFIGAQFEITPATLSVTADPQSMVYGDPLPAFTVSFEGFQFDDDETDLGGTLECVA